MIEVDPIELDITLPESGIGMVLMQPYVELCADEPFRWKNDKKNLQIERIIKAFESAKQAEHGCAKTHFTILPEYAIPGLDGIRKIQEILQNNSWPDNTVIIGGVDGLTKDEYSDLCNEDLTQVHEKNMADEVQNGNWINCCIVWAKQNNGALEKWIQPKLVPSWLEKNITCHDMFEGKAISIFNGQFENGLDFYLLSLICFDWIGQIGSNRGIEAFLHEINKCWEESGKKELHFIFVLQNNDEPNHRDFLEITRNYFEERSRYPFVTRDNCVIIFANTAGGPRPGKYQKYGYSSLICSPSAPYDCMSCPPTFAVRTKKIRNTDNLGRCKDAVLREMGCSIHSFKIRIPSFINLGPAGRGLIIDRALVYPLCEEIDDPRTPSLPVPASIKWINDELDDIDSMLHEQEDNPLRVEIERTHIEIKNKLKTSSDDFLRKLIQYTTYNYDKWIDEEKIRIHDVDNWSVKEKQSLEMVLHSLSIIRLSKLLEISDSAEHIAVKLGTNIADIAIISGCDTHNNGFEYGKQFFLSEQRFVIIITKDTHDSPYFKRDKPIEECEGEITERGPNIIDPNSRFVHCGYKNLKDPCFSSENLAELNNLLKKIIGI